MYYKYISSNTLEHISLHDCIIKNASIEGGNLALEFENIDVLNTHPLNPYDVAKCSRKASLIFENFEVIKALVYDTRDVTKRKINVEEDANITNVEISELAIDFEVLHLTEIEVTDKHFIFEFGGLASFKFHSDFALFVLKFDCVLVCWNELLNDSWFVDFNKN